MFIIAIIALSLHIQNMSMPLINILKSNAQMGINNLQEKDVSWSKQIILKIIT